MAVDETNFRVMASDVQVIVVDGPPEAGAVAQRSLTQLESTWSRFIDTSDISRLNCSKGQPIQVEQITLRLIEKMVEAAGITKGLFDPTTLPALMAAGYVASIDDPSAITSLTPTPISSATTASRLREIVIDHTDHSVTLPTGVMLDAGGLGKGLAADLVVAELLARGSDGALVGIGGDLSAAGRSPYDKGWTLDIENHLDPTEILLRVVFSGGGAATSSTRSRRWTHAGAEQHHTIDPRTCAPSKTDLVAVSVLGSCGWLAEAHATALLVGGSANFVDYAKDRQIEAIATTSTGDTLATAALGAIFDEAVAS